jgi:hypothetical protein
MWDMMRAHGCRFQSLREDFDTTNAAGELVLFQMMNLAQFERRQTSERVEANIAARAQRGLYNGGMVPLGFKTIVDKPGYLAIDEEMADTVRTAFSAFLREGSLAHAARWINDQGYAIKRKTELPKGVSAGPLFKQMERLEKLKNEHEASLADLSEGGASAKDRIVGLETLMTFASHYKRFLREDASVPERKQAVQKFIRKVEVGTETVRIHYIVDEDHYNRELASKVAGSRSSDFFKDFGSNTLTFGAPGQT